MSNQKINGIQVVGGRLSQVSRPGFFKIKKRGGSWGL
jgi:hypothetical protein